MNTIKHLTKYLGKQHAWQQRLAALIAPLNGDKPTEWTEVSPHHTVRYEQTTAWQCNCTDVVAIRTTCDVLPRVNHATREVFGGETYTHEDRIHMCAPVELQIGGRGGFMATIGCLNDVGALPDMLRAAADQIEAVHVLRTSGWDTSRIGVLKDTDQINACAESPAPA